MSFREFGTKLKNAREERGMSQRSLGLALGLSDKTISSYESSRSYPNLDVLKKISEILEKPMEYFVSTSRDIQLENHLQKILSKQEQISKELKEITSLITKGE